MSTVTDAMEFTLNYLREKATEARQKAKLNDQTMSYYSGRASAFDEMASITDMTKKAQVES